MLGLQVCRVRVGRYGGLQSIVSWRVCSRVCCLRLYLRERSLNETPVPLSAGFDVVGQRPEGLATVFFIVRLQFYESTPKAPF